MTTEPFLPGQRTGNSFLDHLGVVLEERRDGYARYRLPVVEEVRGGIAGSVHGGAVCTLIDIAAIGAVASRLQANERMAGTAEINVSFLRPAIGQTVYAEATLLKKGRTLAVCDVSVTNDTGKLVAKGRVGYALRPAALLAADSERGRPTGD
jgi:acyl-CoA thioesterase